MAWNGSGVFSRTNGVHSGATSWVQDRVAGDYIIAARHDTHDEDMATAINACLTKNNESKPTATFAPNADASYDLGTTSLQWRNAYLSGALVVKGNVTLGDAAVDTITANAAAWTLANAVTVTGTWANLGTVTTGDWNGGTIDGTVIGATTPAAASFTATGTTPTTNFVLPANANAVAFHSGIAAGGTNGFRWVQDEVTTGDMWIAALNGGVSTTAIHITRATGKVRCTQGLENTVIGATTPAAGTFTTLASTGNTTLGDAAGDTITANAAAWTLANAVTVTGTWANLGTVTTGDWNGGTIDGTVIGGATPAAGAFTTLTAGSNLTVTGTANSVPMPAFSATPVTMNTGYTNVSVEVSKDPAGVVHVKGYAAKDSAGTGALLYFTLAAGYRTDQTVNKVILNTTDGPIRCLIGTDGTVTAYHTSSNNANTHFDFSFPTT